jgi:hypothetical protein
MKCTAKQMKVILVGLVLAFILGVIFANTALSCENVI